MPNIAFLSTAHIHTKGFLENIARATDGRRAYAIWDDVADRGQRYAQSCGAQFTGNLDDLLSDKAVDGFIICAENTRHLPLLKKVLPVGKPVFCEKPLVTKVSELREVVAWLDQHPATKLHCGYFQPFQGPMQAVAQLVHAGSFGKITRVKFRNAHHAAYGRWFDHPDLRWFHNPELSGGGAFMDMGTHAIHLLRTLFGPVTEVWATIRNEAGIYPTVDDYGLAQLRFASGILGTVEAAWTQTGGVGGLEITGSEKCLWHTGNDYVTGAPKSEPTRVAPLPARPATVDRLVATMAGQVTADELRADLAAALDAVAIMEAAYASSQTGQWVKVAAVSSRAAGGR
jgi:predicted dehydrogenase